VQRVLIVGYGSIGQRHLRIVRESLLDARIMVFRNQPKAFVVRNVNRAPLNRMATEDDFRGVVACLADHCACVSGQRLMADGELDS